MLCRFRYDARGLELTKKILKYKKKMVFLIKMDLT